MNFKPLEAIYADVQAFTTWRKSKPPETIIGYTCRSNNCPLVNYLTETTGKRWDVGDSTCGWWECGMFQNRVMPQWMVDFVKRLDHLANRGMAHQGAPVRADLQGAFDPVTI
jgi:hypothetical protein